MILNKSLSFTLQQSTGTNLISLAFSNLLIVLLISLINFNSALSISPPVDSKYWTARYQLIIYSIHHYPKYVDLDLFKTLIFLYKSNKIWSVSKQAKNLTWLVTSNFLFILLYFVFAYSCYFPVLLLFFVLCFHIFIPLLIRYIFNF